MSMAVASGCTAKVRDFGTGGAGGTGTTSTTATTGSTGGGGSTGACASGDKQACYSGPAGTKGVGPCQGGEQVCTAAGAWGPCTGEVVPGNEDCATPADEDCDGATPSCPLTNLWATAPGIDGNDNVTRAVAVNDQGFIYVAGTLDGTIAFGLAVNQQITSAGSDDIFVAKYAPDGTFLWANRYGDAESQSALAIAVGKNGRVYVTGSFYGQVDFGTGIAAVSQGADDVFVLALSPDGATVALVTGGDAQSQQGTALAVNATGEVIVGGNYAGKLHFQGCLGLPVDLVTKAFLARLDPGLGCLGAAASTGMGSHTLTSLALAPDDSVLFTGSFDGSFSLLGGFVANAVDARDIVVGRVTSQLDANVWTRAYNGAMDDKGSGVAVDAQGDILVGGSYGKTLTIGALTLGSPTEASMFLAKLTPTGDAVWAKSFGPVFPGLDLPMVLTTTPKGVILVGGVMYGEADFGGGTLPAAGGVDGIAALDAFLAEIAADGSYIAARNFGNATVQAGLGIALAPGGNVIYAGATGGPLDFGTGVVGPSDLAVISPFLTKFTQ